jgi:hypothetical protein
MSTKRPDVQNPDYSLLGIDFEEDGERFGERNPHIPLPGFAHSKRVGLQLLIQGVGGFRDGLPERLVGFDPELSQLADGLSQPLHSKHQSVSK